MADKSSSTFQVCCGTFSLAAKKSDTQHELGITFLILLVLLISNRGVLIFDFLHIRLNK
jgi:hypothetical protein